MRQVLLIEMGMGVDLQGQDGTKAAVRAVRDAIGRIYLPGVRAFMTGGAKTMAILVRLAVPEGAGKPDPAAVKEVLPHGEVTIEIRARRHADAERPRRRQDLHRQRRGRGRTRRLTDARGRSADTTGGQAPGSFRRNSCLSSSCLARAGNAPARGGFVRCGTSDLSCATRA